MPDIFAYYVNYRLCYLRKITNNIIGCINLKFSETFHRQRSLSLNVCYIYRCQVFFRRSHRNSSVLCNYILQPCYIAMQLTNRYIVDRRETDSVHSRTKIYLCYYATNVEYESTYLTIAQLPVFQYVAICTKPLFTYDSISIGNWYGDNVNLL